MPYRTVYCFRTRPNRCLVWLLLVLAITLWARLCLRAYNAIYCKSGAEELEKELVRLQQLNNALRARLVKLTHTTQRAPNTPWKNTPTLPLGRGEIDGGGPLNFVSKPATFRSFILERELALRHLHNQLQEVFYVLQASPNWTETTWLHRYGLLETDLDRWKTRHDPILNQALSLLAGLEEYREGIRGVLADWHSEELAKLTTHIQARLHMIQHPADCYKARLTICDLNQFCGFGCQMQHIAHCLLMAAVDNRTLVLANEGAEWRYTSGGWTAVFLPITNCTAAHAGDDEAELWEEGLAARVTHIPFVQKPGYSLLKNRPVQLPPSFPEEMRYQLLTHHGNPPLFFIAQFRYYLIGKVTEEVAKYFAELEEHMPFGKGPIVGLQIRRSDKIGPMGGEAAYHPVEEYMYWADYWFRRQQLRHSELMGEPWAPGSPEALKRQVFVATDDLTVVDELRSKYPGYEFHTNDAATMTAQMDQRYTDASLMGVLADIRLLSRCNFLVCTFSSQVCRLTYELMQVERGDRAEAAHSLDGLYYFGVGQPHEQTAIEPHPEKMEVNDGLHRGPIYLPDRPNHDQLELVPGDVLVIHDNHRNGWSSGENRRTGRRGLFPSYKAVERWRIVPFPLFNLTHISSVD